MTPPHPTQVGVVSSTLYLAGTLVLGILGGVLYVLMLLLLVLVAWSSVYQWLGKVIFSLFNLVVRPAADALRLRQRRKVAPETLSRSPTGRRESASIGRNGDRACVPGRVCFVVLDWVEQVQFWSSSCATAAPPRR